MLGYGKKPTGTLVTKTPTKSPVGSWPRTITFRGPKRKVTKLSKLTGPKRAR